MLLNVTEVTGMPGLTEPMSHDPQPSLHLSIVTVSWSQTEDQGPNEIRAVPPNIKQAPSLDPRFVGLTAGAAVYTKATTGKLLEDVKKR